MCSELLLLEEVSGESRASLNTVRYWIAIGKLASVRFGRRRLVRRSDLDAFLSSTTPSRRGCSRQAQATTARPDVGDVPADRGTENPPCTVRNISDGAAKGRGVENRAAPGAPTWETLASAAARLGQDPAALRERCLRDGERAGNCVVAVLERGVVAFRFGGRWRFRFKQP